MRTFVSTLLLTLLAAPALAEPVLTVSEPHGAGLVAAGLAAAIWIARSKKK